MPARKAGFNQEKLVKFSCKWRFDSNIENSYSAGGIASRETGKGDSTHTSKIPTRKAGLHQEIDSHQSKENPRPRLQTFL